MTESPKYSVIRKENEIEIRQYPGIIQAEVDVTARDYRTAIQKGFNVLAGYIFGNNAARQKIEMTAPVQASRSEKIAMTVPVTVRGDDQFTVAFIMPSAFTLETLPIPGDASIRFNPIPPQRTAAIRFSGYFNPQTIRRNRERLSQWLKRQALETEGDFIIAGYNPPWVPGFLARNEVLIGLKG
jgi:hypothetical protein